MKNLTYTYSRERFFPGFDGKTCKIAPYIMYDGKDTAFLAYGMLLLTGSDVFREQYICKSTDGGKTFGEPKSLAYIETFENGVRTVIAGVSGYYNKYHQKWLLFNRSTKYENDIQPILIDGIGIGEPYLAVFNPDSCELESEMTPIPFPFPYISATPFMQPYEFENGDMLVTYYYTTQENHKSMTVSIRYALEGDRLTIVEVGEPLVANEYGRGLGEPSLAKLGDKFYMTIRSDEVGLFSVSKDGYHFEKPKPWVWDDGTVLENYNTQQRWIRHKEGLYLAYTRKGAHNDHVFRHRAPIFMTRFDEDRECLIRSEEVILVPELGARLGNFSVTDVSDKEFWLVTAEWMQTWGPDYYNWEKCTRYGSDNSIWRAKIVFD